MRRRRGGDGFASLSAGRVVVAIDRYDTCRAALRHAARLAVTADCALQLAHVQPTPLPAAPALSPSESEARAVALARTLTGGRVPVSSSTRRGDVAEAIVDLSRTCRLLVLQHQRLSRLQRQSLGSVSATVAGRVHSRVVTVPEDWSGPRAGAQRVTLGVDALDDDTAHELAVTLRDVCESGARLDVVHAWSMSTPYDDAVVDDTTAERWTSDYTTRLEKMLDPLRATRPDVAVSVQVVRGDVARTLVSRSEECDLLVVGRGRHVHPLVDGLGSVPRAVIRDARCPVEVMAGTAGLTPTAAIG
jgi:nucleotide-binding universal stress UspA family protein